MRWLWAGVSATVILIAACCDADAPATIEEVVTRIRESEARYPDFEAIEEESYKFKASDEVKDGGECRWSKTRTRTVRQGARWYRELDTSFEMHSGETRSARRVAASDGVMLRALEGGKGFLGPTSDPRDMWVFHPHKCLLHWESGMLSDAIGSSSDWTLGGPEEQDGRACVRLRKADRSGTVVQLCWLAMDRNWLPIREETYHKRGDSPIDEARQRPFGVARVLEFGECGTGGWYPSRWEIRTYTDEGKERYVQASVASMRVHPGYPDSLFEKLSFPPGTTVHVYGENHQELNSFVAPAGVAWEWVGTGTVLLLVVSAVLLRRRRWGHDGGALCD